MSRTSVGRKDAVDHPAEFARLLHTRASLLPIIAMWAFKSL